MSVARTCLGPLDSTAIMLHAGQFPFSFMCLCAPSASSSIMGGMAEKVTMFKCAWSVLAPACCPLLM